MKINLMKASFVTFATGALSLLAWTIFYDSSVSGPLAYALGVMVIAGTAGMTFSYLKRMNRRQELRAKRRRRIRRRR